MDNKNDQLYFKVLKTSEESILVEERTLPYFYSRVHFHPEYQLTYIRGSSGSLFIGDRLEIFQPGDIFIIGSDIPHIFISNEESLGRKTSVDAISVFFSKNSFGGFLSLPEAGVINKMLDKIGFGLKITGEACKKAVSHYLDSVVKQSKFDRLMTLLLSLQVVSASNEIALISSSNIPLVVEKNDSNKIDLVYEYTLKNYGRRISLKDVADIAGMTPTSFCKFFKLHTHKTYFEFLIGIRVSNACRLLVSRRQNISEIAYACGFKNLSNFTRQFREIIGMSPRDYRKTIYKQYRENVENLLQVQ